MSLFLDFQCLQSNLSGDYDSCELWCSYVHPEFVSIEDIRVSREYLLIVSEFLTDCATPSRRPKHQ